MDAHDVLWIVDDGKRAGIQEIPQGAAKRLVAGHWVAT
jgi:hypothetical protein